MLNKSYRKGFKYYLGCLIILIIIQGTYINIVYKELGNDYILQLDPLYSLLNNTEIFLKSYINLHNNIGLYIIIRWILILSLYFCVYMISYRVVKGKEDTSLNEIYYKGLRFAIVFMILFSFIVISLISLIKVVNSKVLIYIWSIMFLVILLVLYPSFYYVVFYDCKKLFKEGIFGGYLIGIKYFLRLFLLLGIRFLLGYLFYFLSKRGLGVYFIGLLVRGIYYTFMNLYVTLLCSRCKIKK